LQWVPEFQHRTSERAVHRNQRQLIFDIGTTKLWYTLQPQRCATDGMTLRRLRGPEERRDGVDTPTDVGTAEATPATTGPRTPTLSKLRAFDSRRKGSARWRDVTLACAAFVAGVCACICVQRLRVSQLACPPVLSQCPAELQPPTTQVARQLDSNLVPTCSCDSTTGPSPQMPPQFISTGAPRPFPLVTRDANGLSDEECDRIVADALAYAEFGDGEIGLLPRSPDGARGVNGGCFRKTSRRVVCGRACQVVWVDRRMAWYLRDSRCMRSGGGVREGGGWVCVECLWAVRAH